MNWLSKLRSEPKIFVIGFNKCGTKTFNGFFRSNGINSLHCRYRPVFSRKKQSAALVMHANVSAGRPILSGLRRFQAFSDLVYLDEARVVEGNAFFREMHRDHQDAYFIFNDRPVEAWIASRLSHEGNAFGSFVGRYMVLTGQSREGVVDLWRQQYEEHKSAVFDYFANSDRFLHYDIVNDRPGKVVDFLAPDFRLDVNEWKWLGSVQQRKDKLGRAGRTRG